jgi:16S rRNA (cytosine967-C5)-methyltransferase
LNNAPEAPAAEVLAAAARIVADVADQGRSFEAAFERTPLAATLRAATRAVALGTLRWYLQLAPVAALLLQGRRLVPALHALLIAALHQLEYSRNPVPATVSSAVDATRRLRQPRAAAMINALLRRYLRERDALQSQFPADGAAATAHPDWLLTMLRAAYPERWRQIVAANNAHPPMTLRVDATRIDTARYLEQLVAQGIPARTLAWLPGAVVLESPRAVAQLPGFEQGLVSVQDAGAQLAAVLLQAGAGPDERVLDACAAPGGKTGALLELTDGAVALTAVDADPARLERVAQNLARLGREARLVSADLTCDLGWWDGQPFDRILLDAPCSGTGVIRRHPDIRLLRRPGDIGEFAATQRLLLSQCLSLLRPQGRLLYCTCSVLPEENEAVVEAVLAAGPRTRHLSLPVPELNGEWLVKSVGVQLLPSDQAPTDGFYYACLTVS